MVCNNLGKLVKPLTLLPVQLSWKKALVGTMHKLAQVAKHWTNVLPVPEPADWLAVKCNALHVPACTLAWVLCQQRSNDEADALAW